MTDAPQPVSESIDLSARVGRLTLANPILVASGTFGYAREAAGLVPFERLGGIVPKTVTLAPRAGNRPPRIVETASGMLNAIGLDNDGIHHFLDHHLPYLRTLRTKIVLNFAGKSEEEFARLAELAGSVSSADIAAVELNLSCPNVSGGIDFATQPELTRRVVERARNACPHPILAKLTPNVTSIVEIAAAAQAGGADGVTLINTVVGTAIDWRRRKPILTNVIGGLSGPAIKPVALRCVLQVATRVGVPIIGVGGIANLDDVMEFLVAGASAVQIGTANFYDPRAVLAILDRLPNAIASLGFDHLEPVVGSVQLEDDPRKK